MILRFLILISLIISVACSSNDSNYCITAFDCDPGYVCKNGECVEGTAGNTGNSGDSGNSGNSGDSGNSGNSGDSGNSGNSGNSGDSGNTSPDENTDSETSDDPEPVCGNELTEKGEECDNGDKNVENDAVLYCDYGDKDDCYFCTTKCLLIQGINRFCGDGTVSTTDMV